VLKILKQVYGIRLNYINIFLILLYHLIKIMYYLVFIPFTFLSYYTSFQIITIVEEQTFHKSRIIKFGQWVICHSFFNRQFFKLKLNLKVY